MLASTPELYPLFIRAYLIFLSIIIGLVFGSFGNAWAYRIVHNEKITRGRSHCPVCGHVLGVRDLIPLFSFLFQGGKCRYCKARISVRYPLAETITAAVFATLLLKYGISLKTLFLWAFGFFLMVLSFVDWESMIIPDRLIICAGLAGIMSRITSEEIVTSGIPKILGTSLSSGVVLSGFLLGLVILADHVLQKDTMGGGDIKLVFVIAATMRLSRGLLAVFISCIIGLIFAFLPGARGRDGEDAKAFPFGPALALATWIVLLVGDAFLEWYKGFLYI